MDAVDNINEIIQVSGIDGTFIGPYDLSGSLGHPGELERDDVKGAIKKILNSCRENNIPSGFHVVDTESEKLQLKIDQGCTILAYGIDYLFLRDSAVEGMKKIKEKIKK